MCVMEKDQLIAKGQAAPIFIVEPGQSKSFTHKIYFNMKIHPIWEENQELRDFLYKERYI
jgi:hypothetical protein